LGSGALRQLRSAFDLRVANGLIDLRSYVEAREKLNHVFLGGLMNSSLTLARSGDSPPFLAVFSPSIFHAFSTFSLCLSDSSSAFSSAVSFSDALPPPFAASAAAAAALSAALATGFKRTARTNGCAAHTSATLAFRLAKYLVLAARWLDTKHMDASHTLSRTQTAPLFPRRSAAP
jgi:hypothetical protein